MPPQTGRTTSPGGRQANVLGSQLLPARPQELRETALATLRHSHPWILPGSIGAGDTIGGLAVIWR
ncbi:hypothetical protein [Streptomyces sp. NPDC004296]|uniref:hypothetical protein n=1 Tax=Streptomyces sp. NPDC004296 TaxID=3364697 RepID=UPI00368F5911